MSAPGPAPGDSDRHWIVLAVLIFAVIAAVGAVVLGAAFLFFIPTSAECTSVSTGPHAPGEQPSVFFTEPC